MRKELLCLPMRLLDAARAVDFLGPLALRLYLVPIFWASGTEKLLHLDSTIAWFGNPDWGLGLPWPTLMALLAGGTETLGALLLLLGLGVRFIAIPLMGVMAVAAVAVHWENGWLAIASQHSEAAQRLHDFMTWLGQAYPRRHDFITELGSPVILNNGIEFAVTYFVMLLTLFFTGAGRYASVDYWVARRYRC